MKKKYLIPQVRVVEIIASDIIACSGPYREVETDLNKDGGEEEVAPWP